MLYHNFYWIFSCYHPLIKLDLRHLYSCNYINIGFPVTEDGNRSSFRNVAFLSILEYQTMEEIQKLCNPASMFYCSPVSAGILGCIIWFYLFIYLFCFLLDMIWTKFPLFL
jgi:hypothetical protein